ncbi:MAG: hypothetical protein LBE20_07415 [Deltaproteobacteria bacterium]|jgi:chromosomal replication initiation ATPase DnaA|nr:hypothetical protein [Deltaproteobacteria bacterium]
MNYLSFLLEPENKYALAYFVVHTGVADTYNLLELAVSELLSCEKTESVVFRIFFIYGCQGTGKRHLSYGFANKLISGGYSQDKIKLFELSLDKIEQEQKVSPIVAEYEKLRTSGGLLIVYSQMLPEQVTQNPHLKSRLLAGNVCRLGLPKTEELEPLIKSLAERKNLNLSDKSVKMIVESLPLSTLSFDNILDKLNVVALASGKNPGERLLRKIFNNF